MRSEDQELGSTLECEIISMGDHGIMKIQSSQFEIEKQSEEIVRENSVEYARCVELKYVWEARLKNSPLDTKLQDFVAYHRDAALRFEEWFASVNVQLPSISKAD